MSKVIISKRQFMLLISGYMFGSAPLLIASGVAALAGPDAWLSVIFALLAGLLVVWINSSLGVLYPEKTLAEVIILLLGKWLGGLAVACGIFIAFLTGTQIIWYVGDFYTTSLVPEYPPLAFNLLIIAVMAIALLYGLEATSRAIEILYISAFPFLIFSMSMLLPDIKIDYLMPTLEKGITPALKGSIPLLSFTIFPLTALNMVFPVNTGDVKEARKSMFKGYFLGMVTATVTVLMTILTLGSTVTANLRFPLFMATKEINVGVIFSRIEALTVYIWIVTNFVAVFFYAYALLVGLSQLLRLKSYKVLVLPLALILTAYSDIIYKNVPYEIQWDTLVWNPLIFTIGFILPAVLLIISKFKKAGQQKNK